MESNCHGCEVAGGGWSARAWGRSGRDGSRGCQKEARSRCEEVPSDGLEAHAASIGHGGARALRWTHRPPHFFSTVLVIFYFRHLNKYFILIINILSSISSSPTPIISSRALLPDWKRRVGVEGAAVEGGLIGEAARSSSNASGG